MDLGVARRPGRLLSFAGVFLFGLLPVSGQNTLELGPGTFDSFLPVAVPVTLTNDTAVEAFKLAVTHDAARVRIVDVHLDGTTFASSAEGVFLTVYDLLGGFTLGVFLDLEPPFDGQVIPPGDDQLLATVVYEVVDSVDEEVVVPIEFTDGLLNQPPVDNALVLAGVGEITAPELELIDGSLTLKPLPRDLITIDDVVIGEDATAPARVRLTNPSGPVEGFTVTLEHPAPLDLGAILLVGTVTETLQPELVVTDISPGQGIITVLLDAELPFDGQTIPVGESQPIAIFAYSCSHPFLPEPAVEVPIEPVPDGVSITVAGFTLIPEVSGGVARCEPVEPPNTRFLCGSPEGGGVVDPELSAGKEGQLSFFYTDPDDDIDGFQLALDYDCSIEFVSGSYSVKDTVAAAAEFVNESLDDDPDDGDGCSLTIGILIDAIPPITGGTVPASDTPLELGRMQFQIPSGTPPGALSVEFRDGVSGGEGVPLANVAIIDNSSIPVMGLPCAIRVVSDLPFVRGDCNASGAVDMEDPLFLLDYLFLEGTGGDCVEACNADGWGEVTIADAVFLLSFTLSAGAPPAPPFPECGSVPGADCESFVICP